MLGDVELFDGEVRQQAAVLVKMQLPDVRGVAQGGLVVVRPWPDDAGLSGAVVFLGEPE